MGLADISALLQALPELQAAAEALMTDECVVRRPSGSTTDPSTFEVVPTFAVVHGPARFKVASDNAFEQERESGASTVTISRARCDFPVRSGPFLPGDVVTVIASTEAGLAGRHFRLTVPAPHKTHATAYRVYVEELVGVGVPPWPT